MAKRFTDAQLAECAEREVRQREHVYERQIKAGKMTVAFANVQIAMMREIAYDYRKKADGERLL